MEWIDIDTTSLLTEFQVHMIKSTRDTACCLFFNREQYEQWRTMETPKILMIRSKLQLRRIDIDTIGLLPKFQLHTMKYSRDTGYCLFTI